MEIIENYWSIILSIFLLVFLFYYRFSHLSQYETFTSSINKNEIIFVDKEYFNNVVNNSEYFSKLTSLDLHVRNCMDYNQDTYRKRYIDSYIDLSSIHQEELNNLVKYIDNDLNLKHSVLGKIPWKIVCYNSIDNGLGNVEGGLCHTLGDIIMLPNKFFRETKEKKIKLLIHEKVHVLQRINTSWCNNITKKLGFFVVNHSKNEDIEKLRRHNPDLDSYDYGWKGFGNDKYIIELYNSNTSLLDSSTFLVDKDSSIKEIKMEDILIPDYVHQIEHPNEIMACIIAELVFHKGPIYQYDQENIIWKELWI